ncbi:MAG: threonine/serine exporter family protein [Lachnospiraceae bacterium]|nr:threonine/serine exporter family protein [Lachnospiraceae bacterium]
MGTIGYAVLFNIPKKFYLCCGFTGAAGWLIYHAVVSMNASAVTASFFGTLAVVLTSRVLSVRKKCPIIIFLVSGILPLVPGAGIYYTVYYMVTNQLAEAVLRGMESVKTAFAIVLGIVLVLSIPGGIFQLVSTEKGARQRRG